MHGRLILAVKSKKKNEEIKNKNLHVKTCVEHNQGEPGDDPDPANLRAGDR